MMILIHRVTELDLFREIMELLFSRDPAFKIAITSTISFRNSDVIFRISNFVGKSLKVRKKIYFSLHGKNCSKGVFFFQFKVTSWAVTGTSVLSVLTFL